MHTFAGAREDLDAIELQPIISSVNNTHASPAGTNSTEQRYVCCSSIGRFVGRFLRTVSRSCYLCIDYRDQERSSINISECPSLDNFHNASFAYITLHYPESIDRKSGPFIVKTIANEQPWRQQWNLLLTNLQDVQHVLSSNLCYLTIQTGTW